MLFFFVIFLTRVSRFRDVSLCATRIMHFFGFLCYAIDCFGTYFTHVQTCDNVRVRSGTQLSASVHALHMSKPGAINWDVLPCAPKGFLNLNTDGCGSSVIENMASVSKRRNGVSFTSGEASMRMRVYSQSVRCLTRVSGDKFYVGCAVVATFRPIYRPRTSASGWWWHRQLEGVVKRTMQLLSDHLAIGWPLQVVLRKIYWSVLPS